MSRPEKHTLLSGFINGLKPCDVTTLWAVDNLKTTIKNYNQSLYVSVGTGKRLDDTIPLRARKGTYIRTTLFWVDEVERPPC